MELDAASEFSTSNLRHSKPSSPNDWNREHVWFAAYVDGHLSPAPEQYTAMFMVYTGTLCSNTIRSMESSLPRYGFM